MSPRIDDGRVRTENLGGLYDTDRPYLHAAMNRYTDVGTVHGTLCGSDRSDDRRTVVTDEVTCPGCRQRIDGGTLAAPAPLLEQVQAAAEKRIRDWFQSTSESYVPLGSDAWIQGLASYIARGPGAVSEVLGRGVGRG